MDVMQIISIILLLYFANFNGIRGTQLLVGRNNDGNDKKWKISFDGIERLNMTMDEIKTVNLIIENTQPFRRYNDDIYEFHVKVRDPFLLDVTRSIITAKEFNRSYIWNGNFSIEALFIGETDIYVEMYQSMHNIFSHRSNTTMHVVVTRSTGLLDEIYKLSVAAVVFILYINFGAVLDLYALKRILLRPIGPAIGFVGQFFIMPILSYLIGYFIFPNEIELRLGLLFTGSTPGGGFSNLFTVVLNGNINLSVTMTAFSNLAAFGMMPLWIYTLGNRILEDGNFSIPYGTIAMMSFSLLVPLSMGIAMQKYAPRFTERINRHLQPISFLLIVFVMAFAFTLNSFMFELLSWNIILACCSLPWIGYILGYILALICRQSTADAITIAIETGIQNTGIAIFMLNFTLPQPQADITSAIPVTNFLLTPLPLIVMYLIKKMCCFKVTPAERELEEMAMKDPVEEIVMLEKIDMERRASQAIYQDIIINGKLPVNI